MTRKRRASSNGVASTSKRRKLDKKEPDNAGQIFHPVLSTYYDRVCTLRQFILSRIPNISRRRRHILTRTTGNDIPQDASFDNAYTLLDKIIIGVDPIALEKFSIRSREQDYHHFSQQLTTSSAGSVLGQASVPQSELVDFATWTLFSRIYPTTAKPPHLLCHGFGRAFATYQNVNHTTSCCTIPGLVTVSSNENVRILKSRQWENVHELIGKNGDHIMADLLIHCSIFMPTTGQEGTLYQLSGVPLSEKPTFKTRLPSRTDVNSLPMPLQSKTSKKDCILRKPSGIRFVRHRMLYARAALNAKGDVAFGLRHIHVLQRFQDADKPEHTCHIMKYMFPRQFGLHNVFTSKTDAKETAQPLKDYTMREEEISKADIAARKINADTASAAFRPRLPKRLRTQCFHLIRKLQILHRRCPYKLLLQYYCPVLVQMQSSQISSGDAIITGLATPTSQVFAYVRSVIVNVFPLRLFGEGDDAKHNRNVLLHKIDEFVKANRFETVTLESVMTGMKIAYISWLRPKGVPENAKLSLTDFKKRKEIFAELLYYIIDSFLIPLIRSNFHVTESSTDKNCLFYFRHDVWKNVTEPQINELKSTMLEEMGNPNALKVLNQRELGYSQIRLLPKDGTLRIISNLKRRAQVMKDGHSWLGKSINSVLAPAFSVLKYEKHTHPDKLGSSLFSISDIYPKILDFQRQLRTRNAVRSEPIPLYFVKVDVKSCFDSLPQAQLNALAQTLASADNYSIASYAEVSPADFSRHDTTSKLSAPRPAPPKRRFHKVAMAGTPSNFADSVALHSRDRRPNTVLVSSMAPLLMSRGDINDLQSQHIGAHIVKIGKKYYRQKRGIPQGSVLSSMLCNFFYADFEKRHLSFLSSSTPDKEKAIPSEGGEADKPLSLLLRLIDDFLLITTSRSHAMRFLDLMHKGCPDYGITIKPSKSLVNFSASIDSHEIPRLASGAQFPYCGILISTSTLAISKPESQSSVRPHRKEIKNSLTVEYSSLPGQTFRRKMLSSLKIQMHTMLLDTSHNPVSTVLQNIHTLLTDLARKAVGYVRCLDASSSGRRRAPEAVLDRVSGKLGDALLGYRKEKQDQGNKGLLNKALVDEIAALAYAMMRSQRHKRRHPGYECGIKRAEVELVAKSAFLEVLEGRAARFLGLVKDLRREVGREPWRVGKRTERRKGAM